MSGVTKHIYNRDICNIISMWNEELKSIENLLPVGYSEDDILATIKMFYPHEWKSTEVKYIYYKKKDKSLRSMHKKPRYNMPKPEKLIKDTSEYKKITNENYKTFYDSKFDEDIIESKRAALWKKREPKIRRINDKIEKATLRTQIVTPEFIDTMIGLYERKTTSQKDKVYILAEMEKYYNDKVIWFFFKVNDTELNRQLREEAFYHLQKFNYHPRLRSQKYMRVHTNNKKRKDYLKNVYSKEEFHIAHNPNELEYRIHNSKEQSIKSFDYFISHSSKDSSTVQKLITYENKNGMNIFCDWLNDADYLKRGLLCEATVKVLELRMKQSKEMIFVESNNSRKSDWRKYELNYYFSLNRPIYKITREDIDEGRFELERMESDNCFLDENYLQLIKYRSY